LPTKEEVIKGLTGKAKREAIRKWRKLRRDERRAARALKNSEPLELPGVAKAGGRLLTLVKRGSINYGESYRTRLPGYMDSTQALGQNWNSMAPGLDFVFGMQPDTNWLNQKAAKGLISRDTTKTLCSGKALIRSLV
jgi:cell surface protein SprA